jgi:hypothetical protein
MELDSIAPEVSEDEGLEVPNGGTRSMEHPPGSADKNWSPATGLKQTLHFIAKGAPIVAAGAMIHIIIITILRNAQRALETRDHMAETLRVSRESFSIVLSEDGSLTGTPGKVALYKFYQNALLPNLKTELPGATLYLIAEDDARLDRRLAIGSHRSSFQVLMHQIINFSRPIVLLGYQNNPVTLAFRHRKPDFGMHLWAVQASFTDTMAKLMTEHVPSHFDLATLRNMEVLVGYSSYSIAGFIGHHSDCADARDSSLVGGIRPAMNVDLHWDDYKELVLIPYIL